MTIDSFDHEVCPLNEWLAEIVDDELTPDDQNPWEEGQRNAWSLFAPHDLSRLTKHNVASALKHAADAKSRWILERGLSAKILYVWHDYQKGALCLSLVSASHSTLPFGSIVRLVDDLVTITERVVDADWKNDIEAQRMIPTYDEDSGYPFVMDVWYVRIGEATH